MSNSTNVPKDIQNVADTLMSIFNYAQVVDPENRFEWKINVAPQPDTVAASTTG